VQLLPPLGRADATLRGTPNAELLYHCQIHWDSIFPGFAQSGSFLATFQSSPLVRSVCYALAASHLRHLCPNHRPHLVAEYSHRATALAEYKHQLSLTQAQLGQSGFNAMLLGAVLFNLLAFPLFPTEAHTTITTRGGSPWGGLDREAELGWLTFQSGVGPLMRSMLVYLPRAFAFLSTIWQSPQPRGQTAFPNVGIRPPPVPKVWVRFFQLDEDNLFAQLAPTNPVMPSASTLAGGVRLLVRMTAYIRDLEPVQANAVIYLAFMFKAQRDFRALLVSEHPRAWWIYGYWAGLMRRFPDLWWCRDRAERQYTAIREWLAGLDMSDDKELWAEMMAEYAHTSVWPPTEVEMIYPPPNAE